MDDGNHPTLDLLAATASPPGTFRAVVVHRVCKAAFHDVTAPTPAAACRRTLGLSTGGRNLLIVLRYLEGASTFRVGALLAERALRAKFWALDQISVALQFGPALMEHQPMAGWAAELVMLRVVGKFGWAEKSAPGDAIDRLPHMRTDASAQAVTIVRCSAVVLVSGNRGVQDVESSMKQVGRMQIG